MKITMMLVLALAILAEEPTPPQYVPLSPQAQSRFKEMMAEQELLNKRHDALFQEAQAMRWMACAEASVPAKECGDWDGMGHVLRISPVTPPPTHQK